MATLDIWSNSSSLQLKNLIGSVLASYLILDKSYSDKPLYICSPWISDFIIFDNRFGHFDAIVTVASGNSKIRFSDVLKQSSLYREVRIISKSTEATRQFLRNSSFSEFNINTRMADESLHEKGLLAPIFYLEGSMNFTYSGITINTEKVSYHSGVEHAIAQRINSAYLELDRRWHQLDRSLNDK